MSNFLMGCDPEFFLERDHQIVSAHDLVPGSKEEPFTVNKGAIQVDGTAVEFNITPASTEKEFSSNIMEVLVQLREFIPQEFSFVFEPSVFYEKCYFSSLPPEVKRLGCDPDFNVYKAGTNHDTVVLVPNVKQKLKSGRMTRMRTGAGHIHIGWTEGKEITDKDHLWDCVTVIRNLDKIFHKYSRLWDDDDERLYLYGSPGDFRPKHYGVEYRTPSNAWLKYPLLWPWLFRLCSFVISSMRNGRNIMCNNSYYSMNGSLYDENVSSHRNALNTFNGDYKAYQVDFPSLDGNFKNNALRI